MDYTTKICYKQYSNRCLKQFMMVAKQRDIMFTAKNFVSPDTIEEAYKLNQKRSNKIVGGMLWLKMSNQNYDTIIDLSKLGLDKIEENKDCFEIGAYVTLRDIETHAQLNNCFNNALRNAVKSIVGVQFRNCATVGGSIFGRYGFSDVLSVFLSLDTTVVLYKAGEIPLNDFIKMPFDNDILMKIKIAKNGRKCFYQSVRNAKTDFPVLTCASSVLNSKIRLVFGARPSKAMKVEYDFDLNNNSNSLEILGQKIAENAKEDIKVSSNMRGGKEYRTHLVGVLSKRAVLELGGAK